MMLAEAKALKPLANGVVVIVGVKPSNLADDIKAHPRVVLWDSQQQDWYTKELPTNTQAVFMTRFLDHTTSERLLAETRKRRITIFNPEGTGMIAKQVRELLDMERPEAGVTKAEVKQKEMGKLVPLLPLIDFAKGNMENAKVLYAKAAELGIKTTEKSLAQMVSNQRRRQHGTGVPRSIRQQVDVAVELLDNAIRDMQDMRAFLLATVEENRLLKEKIARLKKAVEE